jgi:FMN-dependent oxidoreductase (nitrilotriacetate monooxygenase family)
MEKQIRLNALDMNCVGGTPGLWRHPEDQTLRYTQLSYWTDLARLLERGLFDGLFIADILGVYDVFGGDASAAFRNAVEFPVNDPWTLVPAMAIVTSHLGFGVTGAATYEQPFSFARRLSTLDHLTDGRVAWNIVTGYLDSAAKAFGLPSQLLHDDRYEVAEEFMEVVYKLWEGSWEDGAVLRDKSARLFADASKIHKVRHEGRHFRMDGYHLCEPSPQRTPFLFQAGASVRGRQFAARHAECIFVSGSDPRAVSIIVADLRQRIRDAGRDPRSVLVFCALAVVADETDAAAQARFADYQRHASTEASLTLLSGYMGHDLSSIDLDAPLGGQTFNSIQTCIDRFKRIDPSRDWTFRDAVQRFGVAGYKPLLIGSPSTVADGLIRWMVEADLDGFNLEHIVCPRDFEAFVDLVVPELQRRGVYKTSYSPGTLREKLSGQRRLPGDHPAAAFRRL